jgi:phosphatidylglycerol lysyltransferase
MSNHQDHLTPYLRDVVMRLGWNATVYQILNPGLHYWFSSEPEGVIAYVTYAGVRVVAGAPVAAAEHLAQVAAGFEHDASKHRQRVCYFCAESRLETIYRNNPRYAFVVLGSQPVWHPQRWETIVRGHRSLRAQLNRARNKGVQVQEWPSTKAQNHPLLTALLLQWLKAKPLPTLRFLIEPNTLQRLEDRRVFVAHHADQIIGFVIASPVPQRKGWLVEQVIRGPSAPNGTAELLIDAVMKTVAAEGCPYVTLGLVPLAKGHSAASTANRRWLTLTLKWVRAHGRRFYNFEGLEYFKAKLKPNHWDPIYAIVNDATFSPRILYAIAAAFSGGSPFSLLGNIISKAMKQELRGLQPELP